MKTVDELRCIYNSKNYGYPNNSDCNFAVFADGAWYPFINGKLSNPLDPITLLESMLAIAGPSGSASPMTMPIDRLLMTCTVATEIREKSPVFITKCNSGAPKTLLVDGKVVILGDKAKKDGLMLSILSSQIAGDSYDQSSVDAWKSLGFTRPRILRVKCKKGWFESEQRNEKVWRTYTIDGGHPVTEVQIVDSEDGFRIKYGLYNASRGEVFRKFMATPKYVWQDKEDKYED
jgi:hypothetical protein